MESGDAQKFPMGPGAFDAMKIFQGILHPDIWTDFVSLDIPETDSIGQISGEQQ